MARIKAREDFSAIPLNDAPMERAVRAGSSEYPPLASLLGHVTGQSEETADLYTVHVASRPSGTGIKVSATENHSQDVSLVDRGTAGGGLLPARGARDATAPGAVVAVHVG